MAVIVAEEEVAAAEVVGLWARETAMAVVVEAAAAAAAAEVRVSAAAVVVAAVSVVAVEDHAGDLAEAAVWVAVPEAT